MTGRRLGGCLTSLVPAALAGAFLAMTLARMEGGRKAMLVALPLGAVYGIGVLALIRLFPVARWAYPIAGFFAGPVPVLLLREFGEKPGDRGGAWVLLSAFGIFVGLLEWARLSRAEALSGDGES